MHGFRYKHKNMKIINNKKRKSLAHLIYAVEKYRDFF